MKIIIISILSIIFFSITPSVSAEEGWVIENFRSEINLEKSGEVYITEIIDVDFNTQYKHGIYRNIPYAYETLNDRVYTEISVKQILLNNEDIKFTLAGNDYLTIIKIGDPNKTITGKNTYRIEYVAKGILRGFDDYDELYWNVTGNDWTVPVLKAEAVLTLPEDGLIKTTCFEGVKGSGTNCSSSIRSSRTAVFNSNGSLDSSAGMTIVAGYKKGIVPLITVQKPESFFERLLSWPSLMTLGVSLLFAVGTIIYLWLKFGRDYWLAQNIFGTKKEKGTVKPLGGHETIVVEFTPPDKLTPAELGVLIDERAQTHDVVSTIIDLAVRGYLTIKEVPKKWVFGKTDYLLIKDKNKVQDKTPLLNYERKLLDKLFESGDEIEVSALKTTFYEELKEIKEELYKEVVSKNLFPTDPDKVRTKYIIIAFLLIFAGIMAIFFSVKINQIFLADLSIGAIVAGGILSIVSQFMPRRTAYGRELYRRTKGYKLFIEKAEKYRQQYFEKENLFNQVLPYAIVFGLTEKFAKAMQEIGMKNYNTAWYVGTHPFHMNTFASGINDFSKSMSTAIASAPKGSGFSGGGSSGGGFGGGGGGSW